MKTLALLMLASTSLLGGVGCDSRALPVGDGRSEDARRDGRPPPEARSPDGRPREASAPRFRLHLFDGHISMAYDYASLEAATAGLKPADAALTLSDLEIEQYQTDPAPSSRILLRLTQTASDQHGAYLGATKDLQPFIVTLDGQRLFVGVVYILNVASAIMTPVLHLEKPAAGRVELKLGRHMGAWAGWGTAPAGLPSIDVAAVRQLFEDQQKLSPL